MSTPECVPALKVHALDLAPLMSAADRREVAAAGERDPLQALLDGLTLSTTKRAYLDADGLAFAIQGVTPGNAIWMLSSDAIHRPENRWFFLRKIKANTAADLRRYGHLQNWMDERNTAHRRLVEWLGFQFGETMDVNGHRFIKFWKDC